MPNFIGNASEDPVFLLCDLRANYKLLRKSLRKKSIIPINSRKYTVPYYQYGTISRSSSNMLSSGKTYWNRRIGRSQECRVHRRVHHRRKYEVDQQFVKELYLEKTFENSTSLLELTLSEKNLEELENLKDSINKRMFSLTNQKWSWISMMQCTPLASQYNQLIIDKKEINDLITAIVQTLKISEFMRKLDLIDEDYHRKLLRKLSKRLFQVQAKMPKINKKNKK